MQIMLVIPYFRRSWRGSVAVAYDRTFALLYFCTFATALHGHIIVYHRVITVLSVRETPLKVQL